MRAAVATGSESIMRQRTTKVVDAATVDVLVGQTNGAAGFKRNIRCRAARRAEAVS